MQDFFPRHNRKKCGFFRVLGFFANSRVASDSIIPLFAVLRLGVIFPHCKAAEGLDQASEDGSGTKRCSEDKVLTWLLQAASPWFHSHPGKCDEHEWLQTHSTW